MNFDINSYVKNIYAYHDYFSQMMQKIKENEKEVSSVTDVAWAIYFVRFFVLVFLITVLYLIGLFIFPDSMYSFIVGGLIYVGIESFLLSLAPNWMIRKYDLTQTNHKVFRNMLSIGYFCSMFPSWKKFTPVNTFLIVCCIASAGLLYYFGATAIVLTSFVCYYGFLMTMTQTVRRRFVNYIEELHNIE